MSAGREAPTAAAAAVAVWQDVEFGSYAADLPIWSALAEAADGPVLELGAGVGRVALHLAERGIEVMALDRDERLLEELGRRAEARGSTVAIVRGELGSPAQLRLPSEPALVIAPLHVLQTFETGERLALIGALRDLISPGAVLAAALVDETTMLSVGVASPQLLPDMRELDGWVYSSEPLWVQADDSRLTARRLRERVSPEGQMERTVHDDVLHRISPERFALEAQEAGFSPAGTRPISSGKREADSVVALVEAV